MCHQDCLDDPQRQGTQVQLKARVPQRAPQYPQAWLYSLPLQFLLSLHGTMLTLQTIHLPFL